MTLKITKLITAAGQELDSWLSEPEQLIFCDAEAAVAEHCGCSLDAVEYDGDHFRVGGRAVASLTTTFRRAA
jgi:hypothetical protein